MNAPDLSARCPGCGHIIDPDVCWCGDRFVHHDSGSGHNFVPMGCECGRLTVREKNES